MNLHSSKFRFPTDFLILYSLLDFCSSPLFQSFCSSSSSPSSLSSATLAITSPALIFLSISMSFVLYISKRFYAPLYNTHFFILFNYYLILNISIFRSPMTLLSIRFMSLKPWAFGQSSANLRHLCLKWYPQKWVFRSIFLISLRRLVNSSVEEVYLASILFVIKLKIG